MKITNQRELRKEFWRQYHTFPRRKIRDHSGTGKMYVAETRSAWCVFVDCLQKDGTISEALAERATL